MYKAYVTELKNVRPHPNADRLLLGDCFGNTVCVNLDYKEGQIGVYFPTDGQLSMEFCTQHNLVRRKDDAGNNVGGYMDPDKRNVTAIRLRGEKSDGLFLPLSCLEYTGVDLSTMTVGTVIERTVNGHEICTKYIPRCNHARTSAGGAGAGARAHRRAQRSIAPTFFEHVDTEQLAYNLGAFKAGDEIEITLKMHGTSQRTGYLPVLTGYEDTNMCKLRNAWRKMWNKLFPKFFSYEEEHDGESVYNYGYVSGTRRTVLENYEGGYYGDNSFREQHSKVFEGKLWKGETVYYEVVGFTDTGAPIMASADNKKLNDKEFIKQYGPQTIFSYGCDPEGEAKGHYEDICWVGPRSDFYVYRMTMTNQDGEVVEYTPDFMRYRCEQMGVKTVPVMWKGTIPNYELLNGEHNMGVEFTSGDWIKGVAERYYAGYDPIGKTHIREGVVVRIINRPKFCAYKHKNFEFKVLEGIVKASAEAPDMEEAQEETNA